MNQKFLPEWLERIMTGPDHIPDTRVAVPHDTTPFLDTVMEVGEVARDKSSSRLTIFSPPYNCP